MKNTIERNTEKYFSSGYHCAESIAKAILEHYLDSVSYEWIKAASAFQGGIGKCKQDVCGALTGGVVAIGILKGRSNPETDHSLAVKIAAQYREAFIHKFGSTNCATLIQTIMDPDPDYNCIRLTKEASGLLFDAIENGKSLKHPSER